MPRYYIFLLLFLSACTQYENRYDAGFTTTRLHDSSRIYHAGNSELHYRPIDVDVWYPAVVTKKDTSFQFGDFLYLLEERANYYTASDAGNGFASLLAKTFTATFKCGDSSALLHLKTATYNKATHAKGKFPIILYFASYNGMGYENYLLFEQLASAGYVVITVNSIGRFPGDMTMKEADLLEQVNDGLYVMKQFDFSSVGIVGYSWGAMAGIVAAGQIPNVKAIVSLDGSEFHHYGQSQEEDLDFDSISIKPLSGEISYLRLQSDGAGKKDSVYNFTQHLSGLKVITTIDGADHGDFCSYPTAVQHAGHCKTNDRYKQICDSTISFLKSSLIKPGI